MKCRLTPRAAADLEAIGDYVAERNPRAALALMEDFTGRWRQLEHFPYSGPLRDDIAPGLRVVVMGNYLAFYRVEGRTVTILRVVHGSRDIAEEDFGG